MDTAIFLYIITGGIYLNSTLKTILIVFASSTIFTLILSQLHKISPKTFSLIKRVPEKWKGKWFIRWGVLLFLIVVISIIVVVGGFNDTVGSIIVGFFISLTDFIFRKPKKTD